MLGLTGYRRGWLALDAASSDASGMQERVLAFIVSSVVFKTVEVFASAKRQ
jgi:hypothetical protein